MSIKDCKIITIPTIIDERGSISFFEGSSELNFNIERIYYLYNIPESSLRGAHAHKELRSIIIAIHGEISVLLDDGKTSNEFILNKPNEGLYLTSMIWREVYNFSPGAVAMIIANQKYENEDYIREYDTFKLMVDNI